MIRRLCIATMAACALPFAAMAQAGLSQERYIVVLNEGLGMPEDVAAEVAQRTGGRVGYVYEHAVRGFSIVMPRAALAGIARDPRVAYVEEDRPVSTFAQQIPTGIGRIFATGNTNLDIDGTDDYRVDVDVAVIDTGIDLDHPDLNVVGGVDCTQSSGGGPPWARSYTCQSGGDDDNNHGTHVAGTIGAVDNGIGVVGVAPGARLHAVKVLDANGSGYESMVVAGIDWVAANAGTIEVANMSLGGGGFSQAEYDAIQGAVDNGVAFAVAAGNSNDDANNYSPAQFDNVLTVSALADFDGEPGGLGSPTCRDDQDDTLADFSNWGDAVQIAAPGVCILSTVTGGGYDDGYSGTSMASPHAAGALALLASTNNPANATDVGNLYGDVILAGNFDWIDDSGDGIKEPLLDVGVFGATLVAGGGGGGGGDPDALPSVSITNPSGGSTVSGTVSVTADASDDNGVNQVEFFAGGDSIGSDSDGTDGWAASWDTTAYANGGYTVEAVATDSGNQTASDSITVTVDNSTSVDPIQVSGISPNSVQAGSSVDVTISGSGFASGASVSLENGSGPAPSASNVVVGDSNTITATITASSGGPPRNRVWDVRITNPDASSDVLEGSFTVTP